MVPPQMFPLLNTQYQSFPSRSKTPNLSTPPQATQYLAVSNHTGSSSFQQPGVSKAIIQGTPTRLQWDSAQLKLLHQHLDSLLSQGHPQKKGRAPTSSDGTLFVASGSNCGAAIFLHAVSVLWFIRIDSKHNSRKSSLERANGSY